MRYAFTFDASACTGCKACQVACKDQHALPPGVLWRRVYEVSGGTWERHGAAWTNSVFAYNVSVGCNHCADPACAAACPTDAYAVRDDGVVWLDAKKCVGCQYCAWACPYGAPQYSSALGHMTKCDLCRDLIDERLPPACVAACPMRALDLAEPQSEAETQRGGETHPFPLPPPSRTRPQLAIKPHRAMLNELPKSVANYEEVRASGTSRLTDLPLVAFTLLGQTAAGIAVISLLTGPLSRGVLSVIGGLVVAAALLSLLHLGTTWNAWRTPSNAKRSALSREVLALLLFGAIWLLAWLAPGVARIPLAVAGVAFVYAMAEVYRIEGVPGWKTSRTRTAFVSSALLLGGLTIWAASRLAQPWAVVLAGAVLVHQGVARWRFYEAGHRKTM